MKPTTDDDAQSSTAAGPTGPDLSRPALPRLNEPAPDFEALTTDGPRRLSDYAGRWLVLFSHPADFTPVCTTEFIGFTEHHAQFAEIGCDLLGLSIDSRFAHIAWIRSIEESFGVKVPFPIIEDLSMNVAHAYGMIQPGASDTSAVRATFLIDPDGCLRAMLYYPMPTGRSVPEILRLVKALQFTSEHHLATPEGWQPGDGAIVLPPETTAAAQARRAVGEPGAPWYLSQSPTAKD